MSKLPNIPPKIFTLSATTIGFLLVEELDQTQQDAIGNWFELIGQILETNASYTPTQTSNPNLNNDINSAIDTINKTLNTIKKELEELKKYNH